MEKKRVVEKYYSITVEPFQDGLDQHRQEIEIRPIVIYTSPRGIREERSLHLVWYSNPDVQEYNVWVFIQLIITGPHLDILNETALISEIATIQETQPQEFEQRLLRLGFSRK
jgi:hypothetical protein